MDCKCEFFDGKNFCWFKDRKTDINECVNECGMANEEEWDSEEECHCEDESQRECEI